MEKEQNDELVCSVIMPIYNAERYIENTINSVLNQTVKNFELICVDDCSKDNTVNIIKELQKKDSRIVLIQNEKNLKVSQTRNNGIKKAQSDWVALIDSDDMWEPTFLEVALKKRDEKQAKIVAVSQGFMSNEGVKFDSSFIVPEVITYKSLLKQNTISCSSVLVEKQLLLDTCFYADEVHEDYLCWLTILKNIGTAYGVKEPLSVIRLTVGSKSRNKFKALIMSYKTYKKHGIGFFKRLYYTFCNAINGIKKYGSIKKK